MRMEKFSEIKVLCDGPCSLISCLDEIVVLNFWL